MADSKITALGSIGTGTDPANDQLVIVDVSDVLPTGMALSGTTKKVGLNQLLSCNPTATGNFTITGDLTAARLIVTGGTIPANGLWLPTTNTLEFAANSLAQYRIAPLGVFSWFDGAGGTRMILNATGLGVGVTPSGGNRLMIQNTTDCTVVFKSSSANVNSAIDYVTNYGNHTIRKSGTAVWDFGVINDATATPAFKIGNASSVGVQLVSGATAWTTLSDETTKDIIEPISNAVSKVGLLRSVIGKFKTDDASKRRSFLIAQDVQSVLPEAVDVIGENNELGLRYTEVIPLLVAAIKELTARVQTIEAK